MKIVEHSSFEEIQIFKFGFHPFSLPKLSIYIYFVDGLLIDTGQSRMSKEIFDAVKNLPVKQIFITHFHEDHTGNVARLQKHFNCPVYASKACCEVMKNPPKISFAQYAIWGDRPPYAELIPIEHSIATEQYNFQLISIPGHTPDMLALYEAKRKWLFSADIYVSSYISYMLLEESIPAQISSIKKLLNLDFKVLLCAHNPQFDLPKNKLEKKLKFLKDFLDQIRMCLSETKNPKQIFKKMGLKENWPARCLSFGYLSKLNMVRSVVRDLEKD